jgi:hypothetical protein
MRLRGANIIGAARSDLGTKNTHTRQYILNVIILALIYNQIEAPSWLPDGQKMVIYIYSG